ncbi:uncharacterized protein LOC128679586 [Plodia interpunctella]|uniref:uncharacterized protein LOC128679586 n=1 Tax=Plodia interpunctella TaxID=58824 RepID=UPI0031016A22
MLKDIGGPGILNGVLVGVVSFGSAACGTPDAPTVFTKVGFYADWIDSIIEQNVARVKKRTTLLRPLDLTPPIFYTSPKTTFQVTPMLRIKKKAREMEQIEMLREIQTKGLLKEFVNKVIGSDEARDLLREAEAVDIMENLEKGTRSQHTSTTTMATKPLTIPTIPELDLNFYSNSSSETIEELSELEADVTKSVDKDKALETQIERDVMDIIDKMNEFVNDTKTNVKKLEQNYDDSDTKNFLKVLYLPEKKRNLSTTSAVSEEINEGIQIPLEIPSQPSLDLTYRNNKTDTEIFLSRQDLIDLFSEALKEEIQIKTKATPGIVVQRSETSTSTIKRNATLSLNEMKISYLEQLKKKTVYTKN